MRFCQEVLACLLACFLACWPLEPLSASRQTAEGVAAAGTPHPLQGSSLADPLAGTLQVHLTWLSIMRSHAKLQEPVHPNQNNLNPNPKQKTSKRHILGKLTGDMLGKLKDDKANG